ncbi:hypothetical protein [Streptomyces coelicoflavus]|uniref:hypothetical protein n=1 Tax=Streptomyces coelicoflavus TaxID=285562 RepID=UPI002E2764E2
MTTEYRKRIAAFLLLSDEELKRPLWDIGPADRKPFLAARSRRLFSLRSSDDEFQLPAHDQRVTDWADTE